ncbi:MAG: ABC transporter ATP-binding protein, partial [Cyanobacteria bacterium P01_F01_bin.53]
MNFRQLLQYITPHRKTLLFILTLLLMGTVLSLAGPWLAGLLADSVIGDSKMGMSTFTLLCIWVAVMCMRSLLTFISTYNIGSTGERLTAELRERLYQHLQALPLSYYQQRRPGETISLLSTDAAIISSFVTDTLVQLLPAVLTFFGALFMVAWLDRNIALLAVIFLPAFIVVMKLISRRLRPLSRAWVEAHSDVVSVIEENLSMLPSIKSFTRERHERARFQSANSRLLTLSRQQLWIDSALAPAIGALGALGVALLLWVGIGHIESGKLDPGQLVALLLYVVLLINPLRTLADIYGQFQQTRGSAERIIEFLQEEQEPADEGLRELTHVNGQIEFNNVSFAYPHREHVLRNLNLQIRTGETLAITGENGAGKSTLAHLLLRFIDPQTGNILIDGENIRESTISSLRSHVGLVAQHVLLLNGTVADNIAYSNPDASQDAIEKAAIAANAHEFILGLPDGYNTIIGDQGVRLSGGQRQRVSLARTLLKDPQILIFDEATAMFDPAGEQSFVEECRELFSRKTVIFITHRAAPLSLADRVIKL